MEVCQSVIVGKIVFLDFLYERPRVVKTRYLDESGEVIGPGIAVIRVELEVGACELDDIVEAHLHLFSGAFGRRLLQLFGVEGLEALT